MTQRLALFKHNTAELDGGAIHALGTKITFMKKVSFLFNLAQNGGAMFFENSAALILHAGINSSYNYASRYGGAIYHEDVATFLQCKYEAALQNDDDEDVKKTSILLYADQ